MIERLIDKRPHDLGGGFTVGRVLPFHARRMVGPFVFFDHMGPVELAPGIPRALDVRPHPHIGLATVTYLYAGAMTHRDSVGSHQEIEPGAVNWMTAGSGITHSERFERARARLARICTASRLGSRCRPATRRWRQASRTTPPHRCRRGRNTARAVA